MVDVAATTSTTAAFSGGVDFFGVRLAAYSGEFEVGGDVDWVRVDLVAGRDYRFYADADFTVGRVEDFRITLRDSNGNEVGAADLFVGSAVLEYPAPTSGTYFLSIEFMGEAQYFPRGTYNMMVESPLRALQGIPERVANTPNQAYYGYDGTDSGWFGPNSLIFGANGNDVLIMETKAGVIHGGNGNDYIEGGEGTDNLWGGWGDDYIIGSRLGFPDAVRDNIYGDQGDDFIQGFEGNDFIDGGADRDLLYGGRGLDTIVGGTGADLLDGGSEADLLQGGADNDTYMVDSSGDVVDESIAGSNGSDTVRSSNLSINLGFSSAFKGSIESAVLTGSASLNLTGSAISNYLQGNAGNNILNGGGASDTLVGLGGSDTFRFANSLGATNIDRITDYNVAQDRIELDNAYFTALVNGFLYTSAFRANTSGLAQDASDRIIYETDTGKLFYDSNGSASGGTYQQFAQLSVGLNMTAGEFFVI